MFYRYNRKSIKNLYKYISFNSRKINRSWKFKGDKELNKRRDYILNALIENTEHIT